ncbi:hypothetical protein LQ327_14475 [Actinomycetospora endophytica]|uniref:Uncharacterized protein n=1 Tax=Actinomycetospora endophytica TaxID=2291215 RepID=A0ABS8P8I1_9PSEU|nr:hypothetical protein [Actinomycetospora endophytica]MCD2194575.1 hypothetical protein [Actinomycetospora endophytica]
MLTLLLVVVAAGLVVASVLTDSLPLAIAGLVVAVVALGLIVWPVLMARRAAAVAAEEQEDAAAEEAPVVEETPAETVAEEPVAEEPAVEEPVLTSVLVVPGRHRYHRAGCSMLDGREPETLDLEEAQEEGFTPCSRCAGALSRS